MSSEKGHWVEELFPPAFQYSAEKNFSLMTGERNEGRNNRQKRVMLTAENIRDIYQRVSSLALAETNTVRQEEAEKTKTDLTSVVPLKDILQINNLEKNVVWSPEELEIFRKEFRSLNKGYSNLRVKVQELEKYCKHLEESLKSSMKESESVKSKFEVLKKANKRQTIHNDILKSELKTATSEVNTLHEINISIAEERDNLLKKNSELQIQLNKEQIENKKLNEKLEDAKAEFTKELTSEHENLRNTYVLRIQSLMGELETAVRNYDMEREQHISTKHGLQELLRHFASMTKIADSPNIDQIDRKSVV